MTFSGEKGITRTKEFLKLLGSPQNTLKVIHVAGTSGKGSTSFMISKLLASQGFKTGLHLSPHLLDIRERMLINNEIISEQQFVSYFATLYPAIEKMKHSVLGDITYFEVMVGFAFYVFASEKVDYAVMETGLGGLYDGTNIVDRKDKLAVITKIGFDHMNVLGHSLKEIAYQKAMICVEGGELISIYQYPTALKEIEKVVRQKKGKMYIVDREGGYGKKIENITLGLLGDHQLQNASLALATFFHLSKRDVFSINRDTVKSTLEHLRFKGRFDIVMYHKHQIILDGAHNVQKMRALLKTLKKLYPGKKFTFVLAFKQGKEYKKMIQMIIPFAEKMLITHIFSKNQDLQHFSVRPENIMQEIIHLGFTNVRVINNIEDIIQIIKTDDSPSVISGSLYLLGDVYKLL